MVEPIGRECPDDHALRVSSLLSGTPENQYRFSEREGWHLGRATPRPQETRRHSLRPQGPRRRLGVVVRGGTCLQREAAPLALATPFPALLAVSSGNREARPATRSATACGAGFPVALLHHWDAGQVVACSVCSVVACSVLLQITPTPSGFLGLPGESRGR